MKNLKWRENKLSKGGKKPGYDDFLEAGA